MTRTIYSLRVLAVSSLSLGWLVGCASRSTPASKVRPDIADAAQTLLEMRPDADWTTACNRLLEAGPVAIEYVASRPIMHRPAAPGDLRVMLHTSLMRLLAPPGTAPPISMNCYETTLNLVHFDPKVDGRQIGTVHITGERPPAAWHELYPADFDQKLASRVNAEADRRAMIEWWRSRREDLTGSPLRPPLHPDAEMLWTILARGYADLWEYEVDSPVVRCAFPPHGETLLRIKTYDYNLIRAACIRLTRSNEPGVQRELIERIADPSPVVAHNARFALERSADPRIREVLQRYKKPVDPPDQSSRYNLVRLWPMD